VVLGGGVHVKTTNENSVINLSASGDVSILTPAWTKELTAAGFTEFADGHLTQDVTLALRIDLGTNIVEGNVKILAADTLNNKGIGDLMLDIQNAIVATQFTVVTSISGTPAVGSSYTMNANDPDVEMRLNAGRFMLTSHYDFTMKAATQAANIGFNPHTGHHRRTGNCH
jgi:hypothetical protein